MISTDALLSNVTGIDIKLTVEDVVNSADSKLLHSDNIFSYQPKDKFVYFRTSGTSNNAKTVVYSHRAFISIRDNMARMGLTNNSVFYSPAKMSFAMGFWGNIYAPWVFKATHVLTASNFDLRNIISLINEHCVTDMFASPSIVNLMTKDRRSILGTSLQRLTISGEPLPATVASNFQERFGIKIRNLYGLTESFAVLMNTNPNVDSVRSGTPTPGTQVRLIDENGNVCPPGVPGRMIYTSKCLADGYELDPKATAECFKDGWYYTNDLFEQDAQGTYRFIDRIGQCVKIRGQWASTIDVENLFVSIPEIIECAVSFDKDQFGFYKPVAFVVKDTDSMISTNDVLERISKLTDNKYLVPKNIHFVNELPKTLTNKRIKVLESLMDRVL